MNDFREIMDRLKLFYGVKSDKAVSECLKLNYNTVKTWSNRNKIPLDTLIECIQNETININWLLYGKGSMFLDDSSNSSSDNITQNISGSSHVVGNHIVGKGNIVVSTHPKPVEPPAPPPPPPVSSYDDNMKIVISLLVYAPPAFLTALREKLEKFRDMSSM